MEISHRLNPKEPPRRTVTLKYVIRMDTPSSNDTPMVSAATSPIVALTASPQAIHTKNKQPFSTRWVVVLLLTNPNPRNYKLSVAEKLT